MRPTGCFVSDENAGARRLLTAAQKQRSYL